jgi:hypothetical protein
MKNSAFGKKSYLKLNNYEKDLSFIDFVWVYEYFLVARL